MKKVAVLVVALCSVSFACTLPQLTTEAFTPTATITIVMPTSLPMNLSDLLPGELIIFASDRDGDSEIYAMKADGSGQVRLTDNEIHDILPVCSPDGERIAFARYLVGESYDHAANIYVMKWNGDDQTLLTPFRGTHLAPRWSPDGQRLVFASTQYGLPDVFVMNADGTNVVRLTDSPKEVDMHSAGLPVDRSWSADGQYVVFESSRDGNREIYIANVETGELMRLTDHSADDGSPTWSPDGRRIAFVSLRNAPKGCCFDCNTEIYVMDSDGGNVVRVTDNSVPDSAPVWSPDGRYIAFTSRDEDNSEIYVAEVDEGSVTRVTDNLSRDWNPSWLPDSQRLMFVSERDGNQEIYIVGIDGSGLTRLTDNPGNDWGPVWCE